MKPMVKDTITAAVIDTLATYFQTPETPEFDAEKERKALGIEVPQEGTKKARQTQKDGLVRNNAAQEGLPEDWTRATFIVQTDKLELLRDYAYTVRITLKEALDQALDRFFEDVDQDKLLPHK